MKQLLLLSPSWRPAEAAAWLRPGAAAVVVSTFVPLESERRQLAARGAVVDWCLLSDFFTDPQLEELDRGVVAAIERMALESGAAALIECAHYPLYTALAQWRRNRAAARVLRDEVGPVDEALAWAGSDLEVEAWREVFPQAVWHHSLAGSQADVRAPAPQPCEGPGRPLESPAAGSLPPTAGPGPLYATFQRPALNRSRQFDAEDTGIRWLDLLPVRAHQAHQGRWAGLRRYLPLTPALWRLHHQWRRLRRWLAATALECPAQAAVLKHLAGKGRLRALVYGLAAVDVARRRGARALVLPLHAFDAGLAMAADLLGLPVVVLQDCYLPVNYPLACYGGLRRRTWLWWNQAAADWGRDLGMPGVVRGPRLFGLAAAPSRAADVTRPVRRVLAVPNHGGKWSALIFRSDIDRFVAGIVAAARLRPDVWFRLRPHPGMGLAEHDGPEALPRLRAMLAEAGLPNLALSDRSFAEEAAWADLAVSEYSLTLLEFLTANREGGAAVLNVTGRRDLFREFTSRGLPLATGPEELVRVIDAGRRTGSQALAGAFTAPSQSLAESLAQAVALAGGRTSSVPQKGSIAA